MGPGAGVDAGRDDAVCFDLYGDIPGTWLSSISPDAPVRGGIESEFMAETGSRLIMPGSRRFCRRDCA